MTRSGIPGDGKGAATAALLAPIANPNIKSEIIDRLCRMISEHDLGPGHRMPSEHQLAAQLNVSRASIREAVSALSSIGVLEQRVGSGTFVVANLSEPLIRRINVRLNLAPDQFLYVLEARKVLEGEFARLAAERANEEDLARIEHHCAAVRRHRHEPERSTQEDVAFHRAIALSARNPLLMDVHDHLADLIFKQQLLVMMGEGRIRKRSLDFHDSIAEAIRRRNGEEARRQMHAHLDDVISRADELYAMKVPKLDGREPNQNASPETTAAPRYKETKQ